MTATAKSIAPSSVPDAHAALRMLPTVALGPGGATGIFTFAQRVTGRKEHIRQASVRIGAHAALTLEVTAFPGSGRRGTGAYLVPLLRVDYTGPGSTSNDWEFVTQGRLDSRAAPVGMTTMKACSIVDEMTTKTALGLMHADATVIDEAISELGHAAAWKAFGIDKHNTEARDALASLEWWSLATDSPQVQMLLTMHPNP